MQTLSKTLSINDKTIIALLFFSSGCAALIYEIVWFHLLQLAIGVSAISLSILLITFMGGMGLGAWYIHRFAPVNRDQLKIYALLEFCIAVTGVITPFLVPQISYLYTEFSTSSTDLMFRTIICIIVLMPPAMLMGATIPLIARWVKTTGQCGSQLAWFYTCNIFGAVFGTLVCAFLLLRFYDVYLASSVAVILNLLVVITAFQLATTNHHRPERVKPNVVEQLSTTDLNILYIVIGISGFTALSAQFVWTRLLTLLFGGTVYTFAVVLAVFLLGMGLGSAIASFLAKRNRFLYPTLGLCQLALVPCIAFSGYAIQQWIPDLHFLSAPLNWESQIFENFFRCVLAILPSCILWGCSFSLALSIAARQESDPGANIGRVYLVNTFAAVTGISLCTLILIPEFGSRFTQQLFIIASAVAAILILNRHFTFVRNNTPGKKFVSLLMSVSIIFWSILMASQLPALNPGLVAYGRSISQWKAPEKYLYLSEGATASVAVSIDKMYQHHSLHIGGKVVASTWEKDLRLQRMLAHYPSVIHQQPESVLVLGLGTGITAGSFSLFDSIKRIVIVEIEPKIVTAADSFFNAENYNILNDPRVEIIYDDARHYINTTTEKFDIISVDPIHPWVKGSAALYSLQFFQACKDRLNQGGILSQWIPLYETDLNAVKTELKTYFSVFSHAQLWNSNTNGQGYDLIVTAFKNEVSFDSQNIQSRINFNSRTNASLNEININNATELLKNYSGTNSDFIDWLEETELNLDSNLRLEYLAGMANNQYLEHQIYQEIVQQVKYPEKLFKVTQQEKDQLINWFTSRNKQQWVQGM